MLPSLMNPSFQAFLLDIGADEVINKAPVSWMIPVQPMPMPMPMPASVPAAPYSTTQTIYFAHLTELRRALENVQDFALKQTATQMVFGEGPENPPLMIIGEAPANEEDQSGRPFMGTSGQLLNRLLKAMGFAREDVYLTNVLPWRPPGNRAPIPDEIGRCLPFLHEHIRLIRPKVLFLLGGVVAKAVLNTDTGIMRLRGQTHVYTNGDFSCPAVPTFHPSYLLQAPLQKQQVWMDALLALETIAAQNP